MHDVKNDVKVHDDAHSATTCDVVFSRVSATSGQRTATTINQIQPIAKNQMCMTEMCCTIHQCHQQYHHSRNNRMTLLRYPAY